MSCSAVNDRSSAARRNIVRSHISTFVWGQLPLEPRRLSALQHSVATMLSLAYMAVRGGLTIQTLPVQSVRVGVGMDYRCTSLIA